MHTVPSNIQYKQYKLNAFYYTFEIFLKFKYISYQKCTLIIRGAFKFIYFRRAFTHEMYSCTAHFLKLKLLLFED